MSEFDPASVTARLRRDVPGLVAAYVFGSVARGDARHGSDLDLGVLVGGEPGPAVRLGLLDVADALAGELGRPVELVVMDDAPVDLVHRILRDGRLLFDGDPSARIRFEVAARNAYFDLAPHLLRYRRAPASVVEP